MPITIMKTDELLVHAQKAQIIGTDVTLEVRLAGDRHAKQTKYLTSDTEGQFVTYEDGSCYLTDAGLVEAADFDPPLYDEDGHLNEDAETPEVSSHKFREFFPNVLWELIT